MSLPSRRHEYMPGKTKAAVIILWIGAALGVCIGFYTMAALDSGPVETSGAGSLVFTIILVASLIQVGFAVAIQKRQNWARITQIVLCAIAVALQAVSLFSGDVTTLIGLGLNIAVIVLLASEESKEWCGA